MRRFLAPSLSSASVENHTLYPNRGKGRICLFFSDLFLLSVNLCSFFKFILIVIKFIMSFSLIVFLTLNTLSWIFSAMEISSIEDLFWKNKIQKLTPKKLFPFYHSWSFNEMLIRQKLSSTWVLHVGGLNKPESKW